MTPYMPLREATRDLHHAAEQHPIGGAMANGTIDAQSWADWINALKTVHQAVDPSLPEPCWRVAQLQADLEDPRLPAPNESLAARKYVEGLSDPTGAAYVFTGAHLMGGALIAKQLNGKLPCAHLQWEDRQAAIRSWSPYRSAVGARDLAVEAFSCVIAIMDEIQLRKS